MKKNFWYVYLYENEDKKDIVKVMKFNTINEMSYFLNIKSHIL